MNIEKVIASQVKLGYLVPVGDGGYKVNSEELYWEMGRRVSETKLTPVWSCEYKEKLRVLGILVV